MSKTMSAFRGSLDGYYQVEDSQGNFGSVYSAGNMVDFGITPDAEELEVISTANDTYGQAADSMIDAKPTKASWGVNRFNINNWDIAFMGEHAARTAVQTTVTDEVVAAVQGEMFKVDGLDVSAETIQDETDTTTFVKDTDYEIVDAALGIYKWLAASQTIHVDYTKGAESGYLLSGGTKSSKYIRFWGRGINRFNNKRCLIRIPRMSVKSSGQFSFVGTEAASMQMEGTMNVPTDGSAPFEIITEE